LFRFYRDNSRDLRSTYRFKPEAHVFDLPGDDHVKPQQAVVF